MKLKISKYQSFALAGLLAAAAFPVAAQAQWGHGYHGWGGGHWGGWHGGGDHFSLGLGFVFPASPPPSQYEVHVVAVTQLFSDSDFNVQDGTKNYEVRLRQPASIEPGDLVRVTGFRRDHTFFGDGLNIVFAAESNDYGPGFDIHVDFPATVAQTGDLNHVQVRGANGSLYSIESRQDIGADVVAGAPVHIVGASDHQGDLVRVARVLVSVQGVPPQFFDGTLTRIDFGTPFGELRTFDGRVFDIRFRDLSTFHEGDHVHLQGHLRGSLLDAEVVTPIQR